jgi:uncharacterized repeat protein (TIGR01451 family)
MAHSTRLTTTLIAVAGLLGLAALLPAGAAAATADLTITKTDKPDPATVGQPLTYTIVVTNTGPDAATAVVVSDDLPKQVDFLSATTTQGACDRSGRKVDCEIGTLENGASATIKIKVTPERDGQLTNTATVSTADADPYGQNDTVTQTTTVNPAPDQQDPACAGQTASIAGTSGPDVLVGTKKKDVIASLAGNDTIRGLAGNDLLCGGRGNDLVKGGADADVLKGGGGTDTLKAGGGNDLVKGGGAGDGLFGGFGDDALRGGGGDDTCKGGKGNDSKKSC